LRAHRISTDRPTDERLWGNVGGVAKSGALSWQSPRAATDRGRECVYLGFGHVRIVQDEINADEFLAWAVGQEGRLELHDGAIVAMSPERVVHSRTKGEVFLALRSAILRAGAPCRVYRGGLGLRVNSGTLFEPDAIVACGPPPHEHALEITSPMIVVEVLSPSTAALAHGPKLMGYYSLIPSGASSSTISAATPISSRPASCEGMVRLDPPGLEAPVTEMFPPE
jgi:hypothetical protein